MKLAKGHIYLVHGIWYVLVETIYQGGKTWFHCICDHANNIHAFEPHEVSEWFDCSRIGYLFPKENRAIPYDVIAEVLIGQHDDRFTHWMKPSENGDCSHGIAKLWCPKCSPNGMPDPASINKADGEG